MPIRTTGPAVVVPPRGSTVSSPSVFPAGARRWATWAWNTGTVTTTAGLDALFAAQKKTGANELYVGAYPLLGRERFFKDALTRAPAAGLQPQLLLGSPDWADRSTRPWLEKSIIAPLKTVRASVPTSALQRLPLHLDIEPHATGPLTPAKMRDFLDTLSWLRTKLGPGFSLQVDIPSWYAGQKVDGKSFTQQILERVDGVTLMAYERTAQQVITEVAPTLAQAAALGKQAMVAVEAGPRSAAVGLGTRAGVRTFLAQLDAALGGKPGYRGCAVHDLDRLP